MTDASYEEAHRRLRMPTLCKDCVRPLAYPLSARIVELTSILTGKLVKAPRAASARVEVPNGVPGMREVVEANASLNSSPSSGANREAERRSKVHSAEGVSATELFLAFNVAQSNALSIPAHAL